MAKKRVDKGLKIKLRNLKNKGRTGKYYYLREDGKTGRYFKYKKGLSIDNYISAYRGKVKIKKSGVVAGTGRKQADIYVQKIRRQKPLDSLIGKGITETGVLDNMVKVDRAKIKKAYVKMLEPLVKDKDLLNILVRPENVEKFKHRIEGKITMIDEKNKVNMVFRVFNKSIDEMTTDLRDIMNGEKLWIKDVRNLRNKGYRVEDVSGTTTTESSPKGEEVLIIKRINKINLKLRYVKAK